MKRPNEADYTSQVAYTRALEEYCDTLAQPEQEPNNFCPRCGKRLEGVLGRPQMHTCTPPLWGHTTDNIRARGNK
jgi:hypothetical protein